MLTPCTVLMLFRQLRVSLVIPLCRSSVHLGPFPITCLSGIPNTREVEVLQTPLRASNILSSYLRLVSYDTICVLTVEKLVLTSTRFLGVINVAWTSRDKALPIELQIVPKLLSRSFPISRSVRLSGLAQACGRPRIRINSLV